jgi:hypothetical protein
MVEPLWLTLLTTGAGFGMAVAGGGEIKSLNRFEKKPWKS